MGYNTRNSRCPAGAIPPYPAAMDLRPWLALAVTAAAGWTAAGLLALMLVAHVGWAGIALIGLAVLLVASRQEMTEDSPAPLRSEEHTSELQSLMRISYAVFWLKKKNIINEL